MAQAILFGRSATTSREVLLWTNPNPTSSFSNQKVSLSGNLADFKAIKIKARAINSDSVIYEQTFSSLTRTTNYIPALAIGGKSARPYVREIYSSDNTNIQIGNALAMNTSGTDNTLGIPVEIYGLK